MKANVTKKKAMKMLVEANTPSRLTSIGFTQEFLTSKEKRPLRIDRKNGKPVMEEPPTVEVSSFHIDEEILGYFIFEVKEFKTLLVCISTPTLTHCVVLKGLRKPIVFFTPYTSETALSAALNILRNNLLRGPIFYRKTATVIPGFFTKLLSAVFNEKVSFPLSVRALEQRVGTTITFSPKNPENTTIKVGEVEYEYNLDSFPRDQVNEGLRLMKLTQLVAKINKDKPNKKEILVVG